MRAEQVTVICWGKASDAFLIASLLQHFSKIKVVVYKIPPQYWISWVWYRIRYIGLFKFVGHLELSVWIRLERLIDKLRGKNIWKTHAQRVPNWTSLKPVIALSEGKLIEHTQEADIIVMTDNIRLSHGFYRKNDARILQIIWGAAPGYMGDSGGFWAYAAGDLDSCGPTIIERGSQYDSFAVIKQIPVRLNAKETLRSIKVKQVIALSAELPFLLQTQPSGTQAELPCRTFYAPTAITYAKFLLNNHALAKTPEYAHKDHTCTIVL